MYSYSIEYLTNNEIYGESNILLEQIIDNEFSIDGVSRNGEYLSDILKEYEDEFEF